MSTKSLSYQFWLSEVDAKLLDGLVARRRKKTGVNVSVSEVFRAALAAQSERDQLKRTPSKFAAAYSDARDEHFEAAHKLPPKAYPSSRSFWLQPDEKIALDSISIAHALRSRNEAFRFVIRVAAALDRVKLAAASS